MSLTECATLTGMIKSPNRLSPWTDRDNSREVRDFALDRMRDLGFISRERCAAARAEQIVTGSRQNAQGQSYAVDYIRQQVIAAVGWDRAKNEGFRIRTTIDVDLQKVGRILSGLISNRSSSIPSTIIRLMLRTRRRFARRSQ